MFVFDASPLIVLASADRLRILDSFERALVVPEQVQAEVVDAGIEAGHADARRVKRSIEDGLLVVHSVERTPLFDELTSLEGLSDADVAVLCHAAANDGVAVMDESYGRSIADTEDVKTRGTAYLVLSLVERGALSSREGRAVIDDLVDAGWYCSTNLYRQVVSRLEEL